MTRWARAGNTQKHKKMPEDPTPWEEFAEQRKTLAKKDKKFLSNKVKKISGEAASTSLKKKIKQKFKAANLKGEKWESSLLFGNNHNELSLELESEQCGNDLESLGDGSTIVESQQSELLFKRKKKKKKTSDNLGEGDDEMNVLLDMDSKKVKSDRKQINASATETSRRTDIENFHSDQSSSFKNKSRKKKKKVQENFESETLLSDTRFEGEEECNQDSDSFSKKVQGVESNPNTIKHGLINKKKKTFFEKVEENREKSGIILLPREVENRLYRMKKALRAKGISGDHIKRMVREARRKAELKYRKITQKNSKTCFNCRETGHVFADCPKVAQDNEQGSGICFKCGSTEHVSFRCHIKTADFPFAKCFICHNTGHLSRNCPENEHGIYPKGGKCNLCGSVSHLRKDCPKSSRKKKDEDTEITVHTINELRSVDDEIVETETSIMKQRKPKVVKF